MKYSVVIAAKDEQDFIADCLQSAEGANELLVIDDESSDNTAELAKRLGAKVLSRKLDGFANQKNFGIDQASNDWILILDADERLTPELAQEITRLNPAEGVAGFNIAFRNHFSGYWLRHGGYYPDYHIRLFNRKYGKYGSRQIHETLDLSGDILTLKNDINHLTYANIGEYWSKVKKYSQSEARQDCQDKKDQSAEGRLLSAVREMYHRYFKLQGFKDGWRGLVSAVLMAGYRWIYTDQRRRCQN